MTGLEARAGRHRAHVGSTPPRRPRTGGSAARQAVTTVHPAHGRSTSPANHPDRSPVIARRPRRGSRQALDRPASVRRSTKPRPLRAPFALRVTFIRRRYGISPNSMGSNVSRRAESGCDGRKLQSSGNDVCHRHYMMKNRRRGMLSPVRARFGCSRRSFSSTLADQGHNRRRPETTQSGRGAQRPRSGPGCAVNQRARLRR